MATEASSQPDSNYWQCTRCTLHNKNSNTSCDACGALNPAFSYDGASDDEMYQTQTLGTTPFATQKYVAPTKQKLEGYRIQGIYYKKQRTHRLQHNSSDDDGANALIALCNVLFLQQKMKWTKGSKRVTFKELQDFLQDILPDLVLNNKSKPKQNNIQIHKIQIDEMEAKNDKNGNNGNMLHHVNTLSSIIEEYEDCGDMISKLENKLDVNTKSRIFRDLGIKIFDEKITMNGLNKLYQEIEDDELSILYRNGYYSTFTKHCGILYEFVTNECMIDTDPQITWRTMLTLSNHEQNTNNKFGQTHIQHKIHKINDNVNNVNNVKLAYIREIKHKLNQRLLSLSDDDVDELEHVLFNFSYIAGIKYNDMSYLIYIINDEDSILFDGFIKDLEIKLNIILPGDVHNLCYKYFLDDTISEIISQFDHQHASVCYPSVLCISNIIKLDKQYKTIKNLIINHDILNKFHNLICIDSGPNIKQSAYNTILDICSSGICIENIMNDGLIITLIERLNDTTNYSSEYKQCLEILNIITTIGEKQKDYECITYLVENGIIDPLCSMLKGDQEDDVMSILDILQKILNINNQQNIMCDNKTLIKYIADQDGLLSLRDLALSSIQHIAIKSKQIITKYCNEYGTDSESIEIVLFFLGLQKYCNQFDEFGIDYNLLINLEAPIVQCIIQNEKDCNTFLFWLDKYQKQQQKKQKQQSNQ